MNLLQTQHLSLQIGHKTICTQLNLQMHAGEIWGILGPNGSGKTTLLHALAGLHAIKEGNILLQQQTLAHLSRKEIARRVGILFQDNMTAFPQTVWDYCEAGRFPHRPYFSKKSDEDRKIITNALHTMHLNELAERNIQTLSGGEKRRLAIAALLAQTPEIYLLDEPINHLDIRYQIELLNHLIYLAKHQAKSIIMSLHDANQAYQYCQRILMLFKDGSHIHGNTVDVMTPENLSRLYGHEMKRVVSDKTIFWQPDYFRITSFTI